jgi:hypothetical protein
MGHVLWWFLRWKYGNVTATDNNGNIYLAGTTSSSDYIATPNTHQTNLYNSGNDAYLIKFKIVNQALVTSNSICIGNTLELKLLEPIIHGLDQTDSPLHYKTYNPNATALNSGQYGCSIKGTEVVMIQNSGCHHWRYRKSDS